ncbi:MAG: SGNH/GDSL hydrolase family protein [Alphaproteobacteria bacterium]|nr:SGNH/GDSL hydrolase family protein [Alphaproteobacteria bacterium]
MVSRIDEQPRATRANGQTNRPRLIVLGDSITAHITSDLQRALQQHGSNLRVDNRAVGGSAISYNRSDRNWLRDGPMIAAGIRPGDVVLFNIGHNDFYTMGKRAGWDNQFLHRNPGYMNKATFLQHYENLIREFQNNGARVIVAGPVPYLRPNAGAAPFLETHHQAALDRIPELSRELENLSKRLNVQFIPSLDNRALHDKSSRVPDGLHLNAEGMRIFSQQIASNLVNPTPRPAAIAAATPSSTPTTKPFVMHRHNSA